MLLNQEKITDAGREFELALRLDPRYAKAHAGVGLVKAYQGDFAGGFGCDQAGGKARPEQ